MGRIETVLPLVNTFVAYAGTEWVKTIRLGVIFCGCLLSPLDQVMMVSGGEDAF